MGSSDLIARVVVVYGSLNRRLPRDEGPPNIVLIMEFVFDQIERV